MASKLKVGRFRAVAKEGSEVWGEAKTGSPQLGLIMKINQGEHGLYDVPVYLPFTEDAEDFSIERLRAMGVDGEIGPDVKLVGLGRHKVDVDVSYRDWNGKEQLTIEVVVPRDEVRMDRKMSADKTGALARRLFAKTANGATPSTQVRPTEELDAEA